MVYACPDMVPLALPSTTGKLRAIQRGSVITASTSGLCAASPCTMVVQVCHTAASLLCARARATVCVRELQRRVFKSLCCVGARVTVLFARVTELCARATLCATVSVLVTVLYARVTVSVQEPLIVRESSCWPLCWCENHCMCESHSAVCESRCVGARVAVWNYCCHHQCVYRPGNGNTTAGATKQAAAL